MPSTGRRETPAVLAATGPDPHSTRRSAAKFLVGGFYPMARTVLKNGKSCPPTLVGFGLEKSETCWPGGQLLHSALLTLGQGHSGHCGGLSSIPGPTHSRPTVLEQGTLQLGLSPRRNLEARPLP